MQIDELLTRLTPTCDNCGSKMWYFCIEKGCMRRSPYLCIYCDQQHQLHRKNEIRLLFLNHKHRKPTTIVVNEKIKQLSTFIEQQKKRSEQLIEKQSRLVELYSRALQNLSSITLAEQAYWLQNVSKIVQNLVFRPKKWKQSRASFDQLMKQFDLYTLNPMNNIEQINHLKQQLSDYTDNPLKIARQDGYNSWTVSQELENLEKCRESIEKFILRTNLEKYVQLQGRYIESEFTNTTHRSKKLNEKERFQSFIQGNRIIFPTSRMSQYSKYLGNQVTQLHSMSHVEKLPPQLESLSYCAWAFDTNYRNIDSNEFPPTLRILRIHQSRELKRKMPYNIDHLENLKYLVVVDFNLSKQDRAKIIRFAKDREMRMLCILTEPVINAYKEFHNYCSKIEMCYTHRYPSLKKHYLAYKRKLMQVMRLARTKFIRWDRCRENVLDSLSSKFEIETDM